ncbi:MAG: Sulfite reductase [ferredoxin] [Nitrospira sp.]|nr:Sulfite reductase [ferredoxin] [Nitrospira sp.]
MNKIEAIKTERDGLAVKEMIAQYAKTGWESIPEEDIQRLKWYGLFLRNPTPGFFMIRVRIPGGKTSSYQLQALADIARIYGNGVLDLTTRQQIQLRQITIENVPAVFAKMDEVGLTSLQTGMDNVRNVMTCPVAGLSPNEISDATPIVQAINEEILGNPAYSNLPRKFNVAVTGCPDNCIHTETQDLALVPATHGDGQGRSLGYNVLVGGKLGSGGYRIATPLDIFVTESEALAVSRAIIAIFREHGSRENRTQARLAFLLEEWGESRVREEVEARVGKKLSLAGVDARKAVEKSHIGIYRQKQPHLNYVGLKVLVGRITHDDLTRIAALAEKYGTGEIRISPAQTLIITNVSDRKIGDLDREPLVKQFAYNPAPLYQGLVSCVGSDYCNLAVIETKSRAVETAKALEARLGTTLKPITMHWSGCPAACGNHLVADIGLLGKKVKVEGKVVDAVDIYVGGRSGPDPKLAVKIMEDVPCERLPMVLEGLVPYHAREKIHRVRGGAKKPVPSNQLPTATAV